MTEASCHCGTVRLICDAAPTEVTDCNCSICRRYGVLWAYYSPAQVQLIPADAATDTYLWDDRAIAVSLRRMPRDSVFPGESISPSLRGSVAS
jgi:hypothetical protein